MDVRLKGLVVRHREAVLNREYTLLEEAQKELGGNGGRLVDIGCGPFGLLGRQADRLAELRPDSIGVDIDTEALARNPNIGHRVCGSCYSLPLKSASVDFVVCRWVFEHLEQPEAAMREFSRVLKPGGFLYIKTPNLWNYAMLLSRITPMAFHNFFLSATGMRENTATFYRANTKGKLTKLAAYTKFRIRKLELYSSSFMYYSFNKELFLAMRALSNLIGRATQRPQHTLLCLMQKM